METIFTGTAVFCPHTPLMSGRGIVNLRSGEGIRPEGCVLMIVRRGHASISVNASLIEVKKGMMLFMAFDMTVIPLEDSALEIEFISLGKSVTGDIFFSISSSSFWNALYSSPAFMPDSGLAGYIDRLFQQTRWVRQRFSSETYDTVLRSEVHSLFILLASEIRSMVPEIQSPKSRAWTIANNFIVLLTHHYASHHDVAYYAGALHISSDYLNVICRRHIGRTAKYCIDSQIVLEIKTLLDTTDIPVKTIAERMHYDDPSYMCRVFRRHTGQTPLQYRNRLT